MALVRRWTKDAEDFHRKFSPCQEDWSRLHPTRQWPGGYRWFRSDNVTPIEYYKRPSIDTTLKRTG
jgi:hypothetical protein